MKAWAIRLVRRIPPRTAIAVAAAAVLAGLAIWHWSDVRDGAAALRGVDPWWAALCFAAYLSSSVTRGLAWGIVLDRALPRRPPYARAVSTFLVGQMANNVTPARLGEAIKLALIARHVPGRAPVAALAGSVIAHRLLDTPALAAIALAALLAGGVPSWAGAELWIGLGGGAVALALAVVVARRRTRSARREGRLAAIWSELRRGLAVLGDPKFGSLALGVQAIGFGFQVLGAWSALHAFHVSAGAAQALLVVVVTAVATAIPLWFGNVGVFQVAVNLALAPAGVSTEVAISYGLGLQGIELLVAFIPGTIALAAEGVGFRRLRRIEPEPGPGESEPAPSGEPSGSPRAPGPAPSGRR